MCLNPGFLFPSHRLFPTLESQQTLNQLRFLSEHSNVSMWRCLKQEGDGFPSGRWNHFDLTPPTQPLRQTEHVCLSEQSDLLAPKSGTPWLRSMFLQHTTTSDCILNIRTHLRAARLIASDKPIEPQTSGDAPAARCWTRTFPLLCCSLLLVQFSLPP